MNPSYNEREVLELLQARHLTPVLEITVIFRCEPEDETVLPSNFFHVSTHHAGHHHIHTASWYSCSLNFCKPYFPVFGKNHIFSCLYATEFNQSAQLFVIIYNQDFYSSARLLALFCPSVNRLFRILELAGWFPCLQHQGIRPAAR